jgi:hypothetical protein
MRHGLDGHIPRLVSNGIGIVIGPQKCGGILHLAYKRGSKQHLGQQRIGI